MQLPRTALMAFPITIDPQRRFAHVKVSGSVRGAEIAETIVALFEDPAWQPGFNALWDGRGITELLLEAGDLKRFADLVRAHAERAGSGTDVILTSRKIDAAMASVYQLMARTTSRQAHVCGSEAEMIRILGFVP